MSLSGKIKQFTTCLLILAPILSAQDGSGIERLSSVLHNWSTCTDVEVQDRIAYCATGITGLQIVDVSDSDSAFQLGHWDGSSEFATSVFVRGDYAYLSDRETGLTVINVEDPENPILSGLEDTPGTAWDVFVYGDFAYVADGSEGLSIIDVFDPTRPAEAAHWDMEGIAMAVFVVDDVAYVAASGEGLYLIDVSDPVDPIELDFVFTPGRANDVIVEGGFAYIADQDWGLRIIDVSNPEDAFDEVSLRPNTWIWNIDKSDSLLYASTRNPEGLMVIDLNGLIEPEIIEFVETPPTPWSVQVVDEELFIASGVNGIMTYDITYWDTISTAGSFSRREKIYQVAQGGDYQYAALRGDGLRVVDISDPVAPEIVVDLATDAPVEEIIETNTGGFIANGQAGILSMSFEAPDSIVMQDTLLIEGGNVIRLAYADNNLLAISDGDVYVIDVSQRDSMELLDTLITLGRAVDVVELEDIYCVVDWNQPIQLFGVEDFEPVGTVELEGVFGIDGYSSLCVALYDDEWLNSRLKMIDFTEPDSPEELWDYEIGVHAEDISLYHNDLDGSDYIFVACGLEGVKVIRSTADGAPHEVAWFNTSGKCLNIAVDGENRRFYTADFTNAGIYDFSEALGIPKPAWRSPDSFGLLSAYPNPFNSSTILSFNLPFVSTVDLRIYDSSGRLVADLVSQSLTAGTHRIDWRADGLPSGTFFGELQTVSGTETVRLSLIK